MRFYRKTRSEGPSVMLVPLIDIMMALLMFLLVSTTFKTQPIVRVHLPASSRAQPERVEADWVVVTVSTNAPYFAINGRPVDESQLAGELAQIAAERRDRTVSLRADERVPWGRIVMAMDAIQSAGFAKPVAIFTRQKQAEVKGNR